MKLATLLEENFRGDIRFRGEAYIKKEQIEVVRVTAEAIFGVVDDGQEFQTQLQREEGELKLFCNCVKGESQELKCKHIWATILLVDEGDYLTGSPKPGYIPPFVVEAPAFAFEDDDEWAESFSTGDVYQPVTPRHASSGDAVKLQPRLRAWEARLLEVRNKLESHTPVQNSEKREIEIFYEIDIAESKKIGQLVIETSQHQRRANGQWGKLKPLKLKADKLDDVDHSDDRRILAYLSGSTPERSNWHAQQSEANALSFRYRLPFDLCQLVLPMMCATGRLRYHNNNPDPIHFDSDSDFTHPEGDEKVTSLTWEDENSWELAIRVTFNEEDSQWKLTGELQQGEEVLSLQEAILLLPGGLLFRESTVSPFRDRGTFEWVPLLQLGNAITVTEDEAHELVDQLLDMPSLPKLELPEDLKLEEVECQPKSHLTISSPNNRRWRVDRLYATIQFEYMESMVAASSGQWAIVQRNEGRCLLRDRKFEEQAWQQLQEHGFRKVTSTRQNNYDVDIAARDLGRGVRLLIEQGWVVHADGKQVRQPAEMQFKVKSGIDWFELHADVDFEGHSVSFPALLSALTRGETTIRLNDGSLGIIPEEWAKQYGLLGGLGIAEEEHIRFDNTQVALLDALLTSQESVDYDEKFQAMSEKFRSFDGIDPIHEHEDFVGELRPYQRDGLGWLEFLKEFHLGGCLADDMGLGKTVQILAMLEDHYRHQKKFSPSLIVVPKSLMFNWHQECNRFTPDMNILDYSGLDRAQLRDSFHKYHIILTTYGTLRRDIVTLKDIQFDYIILDEAQTIKNANSQVAKASRLLRADHRVALSGTPIENHMSDLWSIFEFLNPGMLGRSAVFKTFASNAEDEESRKLLAQGLAPFILRRTKKEVASDLPDKTEQTLLCDMGPEQQSLYDELKDHYRNSLLGLIETQGLNKSKMHVLEALLRLRQAACHPALLNRGEKEDSSAKLDVLVPHLQELIEEGHKALVFSQFTSMLSILKVHLDKKNINYEYLDGQTRDRQACVENFQTNPDCGAFLISLKAGGLGLNLTAADYVFLLDPWWNPAVEAQAIDRAHRVGQTKQVFAYRLIIRGTVEEKIAELQQKKKSLADAILQADKNLLSDLSTSDLEMLLS